ncbi:MAG: capsid protein [Ruminococcus sp.]|nr:capsid protein [Ruminococcus sp.]
MPNSINYAVDYSRALAQAYPYALYFGDLYNTPNNGRYKWINSKTIAIPSISTTGRVNGNRDQISGISRNYDNAWEQKELTNHRKWSTLVHPEDIDQTNMVASITNITRVFNEENKFPEMDAYTISKFYALWTAQSKTANTTALTAANVLTVFDTMMKAMTDARVPETGRILYVTTGVKDLIKNAQQIQRTFNVQNGSNQLKMAIDSIDLVKIVPVPDALMKTAYDFTTGWAVGQSAKQINMFLVHPSAVITPISYQFSKLDEPSAGSEGKYIYFEESFEDVFILNRRVNGLQFNITNP